MSLSDAQTRVDRWISQFGELAREVNHRFGQKTKKQEEPEGDLAMEMADVLFVLICMANREGIDLQEAFDRMMEKVDRRDASRWTKKER
jgi:NTP pyrophosphatase (non-canonical NTP hydrolase)